MLETNFGNFGKFKDMLLFMKEENLKEIKILKVEYCLDEIIGKGTYTIEQIESIVKGEN
jgi:hypothetical protein